MSSASIRAKVLPNAATTAIRKIKIEKFLVQLKLTLKGEFVLVIIVLNNDNELKQSRTIERSQVIILLIL